MEITKLVGATCGSLLVFLLINAGADGIYHSGGHGGAHAFAYNIEVEGAEDDTEDEIEVAEISFEEVFASADASAGESTFRACKACHKLEPGANGVGPYLHGIVGRDIGAADGYSYSNTLASMDGDWTPENLNGFLEAPSDWAEGTKMNYRGLRDVEDRANLIAYLATFE